MYMDEASIVNFLAAFKGLREASGRSGPGVERKAVGGPREEERA